MSVTESLKLNGSQFVTRYLGSSIINTWLIVVTFKLSRMLRTETENWTLTKNNLRLLTIVWGYIISYLSLTVYDIYISIAGYKSIF